MHSRNLFVLLTSNCSKADLELAPGDFLSALSYTGAIDKLGEDY